MNTLDSRFLSLGDCFGQKFSKVGVVRYFVTASGLSPGADKRSEGGYVINVTDAPKGTESQQHNVQVIRGEGKLAVTPAELEIHVGDGVMWYTTDAKIAGFQVAGAGGAFGFDSAAIRDSAIYTHAFGAPGVYDWRDPNGSGAAGSVEVQSLTVKTSDDRDKWLGKLQQAAGFQIRDGKSSPASVSIVTGQTVFWSVAESAGVAVTDTRFLSPPLRASK
ncbi:MAG TPA: hypothetical protein VIY49_25445 [Bryobacteraceae bacterium]